MTEYPSNMLAWWLALSTTTCSPSIQFRIKTPQEKSRTHIIPASIKCDFRLPTYPLKIGINFPPKICFPSIKPTIPAAWNSGAPVVADQRSHPPRSPWLSPPSPSPSPPSTCRPLWSAWRSHPATLQNTAKFHDSGMVKSREFHEVSSRYDMTYDIWYNVYYNVWYDMR